MNFGRQRISGVERTEKTPIENTEIESDPKFRDFREELLTRFTEYLREHPKMLDKIDRKGEYNENSTDEKIAVLGGLLEKVMETKAKDFYFGRNSSFFDIDIAHLIKEVKEKGPLYPRGDEDVPLDPNIGYKQSLVGWVGKAKDGGPAFSEYKTPTGEDDSIYADEDDVLFSKKTKNINPDYLKLKREKEEAQRQENLRKVAAKRAGLQGGKNINPEDYPEVAEDGRGRPVGFYNPNVPLEAGEVKKRPAFVKPEEQPEIESAPASADLGPNIDELPEVVLPVDSEFEPGVDAGEEEEHIPHQEIILPIDGTEKELPKVELSEEIPNVVLPPDNGHELPYGDDPIPVPPTGPEQVVVDPNQNEEKEPPLEEEYIPSPVEKEMSLEDFMGQVNDFSELYNVLDNVEFVKGSDGGEIPVSKLKNIIEDVRQGKSAITAITRTSGLRKKVQEFLGGEDRNKLINDTASFDELVGVIDGFDNVYGKQEVFSPEQLKDIITAVRRGDLGVEHVTRTYGLRNKVMELLEEEEENNLPEIILDEEDQEENSQDFEREQSGGLGAEVAAVAREAYEKNTDRSASRWSTVKNYISVFGKKLSSKWFKKQSAVEDEELSEQNIINQHVEKIKEEMLDLNAEMYNLSGKKYSEDEIFDEYLYHQEELFTAKLSRAHEVEEKVVDNAIKYLQNYLISSGRYGQADIRNKVYDFENALRKKLNNHRRALLVKDVQRLYGVVNSTESNQRGDAEAVIKQAVNS